MTALFKNSKRERERELEAERSRLDRRSRELDERESSILAERQLAKSELERAEQVRADAERYEEYGRIHSIPTEQIIPNPAQPRKQFEDDSIIRLADSIRRCGILQPLTVRRLEPELFEIVAGERRLRAAKLLQLASVPCLLVDADSKKSAELAIIENIQRENLNIFEQASSIAALIDIYKLTQEEAARQLSVSQSFVANKLRILRLTAPEREKILQNNLTERHARALLKVESVEQRLRIIDYIVKRGLNVATTESYIDRFVAEEAAERSAKAPRRIVLKDIRLFYNSIDKAVDIVRQAGIDIESEREEGDNEAIVTIRIRKHPRVAERISVSSKGEARVEAAPKNRVSDRSGGRLERVKENETTVEDGLRV